MGNVASCAPSIISSNVVVKVVFDNGRLGIYTKPVTAAELMLENPGQFVCDSCNLKVGHRIPGVSADEELVPKQLYFLLPIEMLYSVLTNEEMDCLNDKESKALKHGSLKFSRIFPVLGDFCLFPNSQVVKKVEIQRIDDDELVAKSYSRQRSWRPALETIVETPPHTSGLNV